MTDKNEDTLMLKANYDGLAFAATVNDHSPDLPKGRGDCFDFGSFYGCKTTCPMFARGDCETAKDDSEAFSKMVNQDDDIDYDDLEQIKKYYPNLSLS